MNDLAERKELEPEVLAGIQAFAGPPEVSAATDQLIAGNTLVQTKTTYTTAVAVQKPRSLTRVVSNVLEEAKLAGAAFYYRWEVYDSQKKRKVPIEGPSIDLAMCLARNYGNCAIDIEGSETGTHYMLKGVFIDLETGFTCPRLFRQRKSQSLGGKMDKDRQEDIVFQIGQSKAQRNAIVKAMPDWLLQKAIETAKDAEIKGITPENIHLARQRVLDFFFQYGIEQERIEAERGRAADKWTPQDIADLRGMATALKEGRRGADELFVPTAQKQEMDNTRGEASRDPTTGAVNGSGSTVPCPNADGEERYESYCKEQDCRDGCPSWQD